MFSGFGAAAKPKPKPTVEEPKSWQEIFTVPSTDQYLAESKQRSIEQREQSLTQPADGNFSSTSGNQSGRPTPAPRTSLGAPSTVTGVTTQFAALSSGSGFTGFLSKASPPAAAKSAASTDSGAHSAVSSRSSHTSGDGFRTFGGRSAPDPFAPDDPAPAPPREAEKQPAPPPEPAAYGVGFGCGSGGFGGIEPPPRSRVGFAEFGGKSAPPPVFEEACSPRPEEKPAPGAFGSGGPGVARMLQAAMVDSVRTRGVSPFSSDASPAKATGTRAAPFTGFGAKKSPEAAPAASGFTGFGACKTTVEAPAKPADTPASCGFTGFAAKATEAPAPSGFAGFGVAKSVIAPPEPPKSAFGGFGAKAAQSSAASGFAAGFGASKPDSGFTGFGVGKTMAEAPAKPPTEAPPSSSGFSGSAAKSTPAASGFTGFGVNKSPEAAPTASGFTGFGAAKNAAPPPASTSAFRGFGATKTAVEAPAKPADSGFTGFGANKSPEAAPAPSGFTGFGVGKTMGVVGPAKPATEAAPSSSGFTGFGAGKQVVETPVRNGVLKNSGSGFSGFGTMKGSSPPHCTSPSGRVQMDFGTLHVKGPAHIMSALAENERRRSGEQREVKEEVVDPEEEKNREQQPREQRRVRFSDVEEEGKEVKRESKQEPEDAREAKREPESDSDDDATPEPRYPWGKRPIFREMLQGGCKLALANPPPGVSNFFVDKVHRSYGCTYDNPMNMFYATSPGNRGRSDGTVIAMRGSCTGEPIVVATGLLEPAAIAVYEPGLSVCTVTNRGIFVFTHVLDEQGLLTGKFLARQISFKGFHRGIAATAGGGIVSFSNGRVRLFDGNVANGDERVLAEANYDKIINEQLFADNMPRRNEKSNCCFMDIVNNRLVMSDLQKHVISLWQIVDESPTRAAEIVFLRAVDVAVSANARGKMNLRGPQIPLGKCAYASGIRLDAEGWVLCADADGRTIQIFDDQLQFVTRIETAPNQLPYISGLYIANGGHLMVCDRKSEMGGLRVFIMEPVKDEKPEDKKVVKVEEGKMTSSTSFGFAAAARLQQGGGRF